MSLKYDLFTLYVTIKDFRATINVAGQNGRIDSGAIRYKYLSAVAVLSQTFGHICDEPCSCYFIFVSRRFSDVGQVDPVPL